MPKSVKIRAFKISVNDLVTEATVLSGLLNDRLEATSAQDRRMVINDNDNEEDLISDFSLHANYVFGAMLRIRPSDNIPEIPDELFEHRKIQILDLENIDVRSTISYKDHYYFMISGDFLVTNLKGTTSITRLQTYLNWVIEEIRGNKLYELTPLIVDLPNIQLSELSKIRITDPANVDELEEEDGIIKKSLGIDLIKKLLNDVANINELALSEIISAEVTLKLRRPTKMSIEEYKDNLGAYMKPISDIDNVTFYPKKGAPIKGVDLLMIKDVVIDTTTTNMLNENNLKQEMEKFLGELNN